MYRPPHFAEPTVPSIALSGAADLITAHGQDPIAIARQSGLPGEALFSNDVFVTGTQLCAFLENAARACNERFFGLRMALRQGMQLLGPIWLLMRNSPTIGEALKNLEKHFLLHTNIAAVSRRMDAQGLSLCYEVLDRELVNDSQVIEHGFTLTCIELKNLLGEHWQPDHVQFRYGAPYNLAPLQQVFGTRLHFDQDCHAIHIPSSDLALAITGDVADRRLIGRRLELDLEAQGEQVTVRTELAIRALVGESACQLDDIARLLGLSGRSLQRRLRQQGTSFQTLYDKVRIDLAKKYLAHSRLSVAAVAERLHYSETAAFSRSFKRLAGVPPRTFRAGAH